MRRHPLRSTSVRSIKPSVEPVEARVLLATFLVTNTNDDGNLGSLRFAINQSNSTPGSNIINFNIAPSGVQTIDLLSALPAITVPVLIDGTTEMGTGGTPLIQLDGAGAGANVDGLDISAGATTVKGLAINQFSGIGISLSGAGGDTIQNSYIGTDPTGTIAEGNEFGILVQANSNNNVIQDNLVSGNTTGGIILNGTNSGSSSTFTSGNLVAGNLIGTDVTGKLALSNGVAGAGIGLENDTGTTIGGTTASTRNIISGNSSGIIMFGADTDVSIEGNYIGTDITGSVALGNVNFGIGLTAGGSGIANITVGGTTAGSGNVIAGGGKQDLINFNSSVTANLSPTNITIQGNLIGTDASGTKLLGTGSIGTDGISLTELSNVTIGGTASGAANVISGSADSGIVDDLSTGVVIEGNKIGTDISGTKALGNKGDGILALGATDVTIGGSVAGAGNVISSNALDGILSQGVTGALIEGNLIGTDSSGTLPLGNGNQGINSLGGTGSTIGGTVAAAGNVVSSNLAEGIFVQGTTGMVIQGNFVGTDVTGSLPLGNAASGIEVFTSGFTIGGLATGEGNIIANNGTNTSLLDNLSGIEFINPGTNAVSILSNSIYNNEKLGIYLGGANNAQAAPVLSSAFTTNTTSTISGTLTSPDGTYTLQFFASPTLNPSGNAEGETLLGTATVTITAGTVSFSEPLPMGFTPGDYITATATDSTNDTSQFSAYVAGQQTPVLPTLAVVASAPSVPAGQQVTDTFVITNSASLAEDFGVIFSDAIPAGVKFVSGTTSTGVAVSVSGGVATAVIGTLTGGESVIVTIILSPTIAAEPSFTNTGDVTASTPPVTSGTITASVTTDVVPSADVAVLIASPTSPIEVGESLVYLVQATNNGPSPATGVILTDTLPANVTFVSATSSSGETPTVSNGVVIDSLPTLAAGSTEVLTITVIPTVSAPPSVTDTADVSANEFDPNPANNTSTLTSPVSPVADLAVIGMTIIPTPVSIGSVVTITIAVANLGPSTAPGVSVSDTLPAGLSFLAGTSGGGNVAVINGSVILPVGTLLDGQTSIVTIVALTTATGTIIDSSIVSGNVSDPNPTNDTGTATVVVNPLADLSVVLTGPSVPVYTGDLLTYIAVVTNSGPSPATDALLADPLFPGAVLYGIEANGVAGSLVNGVAEQPLGTLASGASVTVVLMVIPTLPGTVTNTVIVASPVDDPNPDNNHASVSTVLITPMSLITFSSPAYEVNENGGYAALTLFRLGYLEDDVTVHFSTVAGGNATPGLDYVPVSETVSFPANVSQETVLVPVLDNPYDNHNEVVKLQLDTPTGSAILDPDPTSATLTIIDIDPVLVGPIVTAVKLNGYVTSITSIEVDTTGSLNPTTATDTANYTLTALGAPSKQALPYGTVVPVTVASYDSATGSVTLTPAQPLPGNELFSLKVNGSRPGAVADLAGNPLNSVLYVTHGSDYNLTIARGNDITYNDQNNDPVTLKLSGPGTVDIDRYVVGDLEYLQVVGGVANQTVVTGTVHPTNKKSLIQSILGLGQFGSIRLKMTTPAFYVANVPYPNLATQVDSPAFDTLLPTPPPAPKTKAKAVKVKTAALTSNQEHPAKVHAAEVKKPSDRQHH